MQGSAYSSFYELNTGPGIVVALFLFVIGLVVVRLSHHTETLSEQYKLFIVAYLARIAMILLIYNAGLISIVTDMDSSGWVGALDTSEQWQMEGYNFLTVPIAMFQELSNAANARSSHVLHKLAYAALFLVTGLPGRISAASLNALFGALIPVLGYRISIQIFGDIKAARYLSWVLALMPSLLVFSALTSKEPFVVFFEVLGLYCCVQIAQRRFRLRYLSAFVLSAYCMIFLRYYVFNVLIGSMIVAFVVPVFMRGRFRKYTVIMGLIASPIVMYVGYTSAVDERQAEAARTSLQTLRSYGAGMGGRSFVENPFDITQPSQFVPGLLFGLAHLMYAPFPWNLARGSTLMLLTTPEVLWWYYVGTVRLFRGIRYGLRENFVDSLIPILFCLPLLYYYSLIFSNIGLAYRYRAQIYPELILFVGFGYKRLRTMHGYQSYALPEPEDQNEYVAIDAPDGPGQPWAARSRFDSRSRYQPPQWQDRNDRFRRM
ncbi:phospholipid carrier-dependent glycosyltransferase [bacterium]|nr:phospholipid carrier-dependent glycosyltransferase [bacterium]